MIGLQHLSIFKTFLFSCLLVVSQPVSGTDAKNTGIQLAENPPMKEIFRPAPDPALCEIDLREGFILIESLDQFREVIKGNDQRIRMKPGIYRAAKVDPPLPGQEHVFAVTGSGNYFDLRGAVFETPVSLQSKLSGRAHVSDTWHINGHGNTFEGGYFRNVVDREYPDYRVTENEFEVCGNDNSFLDCTFVIIGSIPYGYTDYYGKGGPNFGRLNKHSFMSLQGAKNTTLKKCRVYQRSFGHGIHFHQVDGVKIEDCFFTGALRPTNDIFLEKAGRAREYDFKIMYRGERPIPRDQMIPLTEDGIRSYDHVRNIVVENTVIERFRGAVQLLCEGDVTLSNVTVLEAGDFGYDVSSGDHGRVVMENCRADLAYNPIFNLTRGAIPVEAQYEVTILSPGEGVEPTARTGLGVITGEKCTFLIHDGTSRPLPERHRDLLCGGRHGLRQSTIINETEARLILDERVVDCQIRSRGPVENRGRGNDIARNYPPDVQTRTFPIEEEYYLFTSPCRSLEQIKKIQAEMPQGVFSPPVNDWTNLRKTYRKLQDGGALHIYALGDSIVNDTMRSGWVAKLREAYPEADIQATVYVRGGGGCQHYRIEERIHPFDRITSTPFPPGCCSCQRTGRTDPVQNLDGFFPTGPITLRVCSI